MKKNALILKIILLTGLILSVNPVYSQDKFEISGGFGWPDMLDIGVRYGNNFQVGLNQSFWISPIPLGQTAAEIYYHFGGKSEFTDQKPWYLLGSLGILWGSDGEESDIYFCPRIGRSFYFSGRSGISLDGGAFLPLTKGLKDFLDSPIYPSGSISFFFRF